MEIKRNLKIENFIKVLFFILLISSIFLLTIDFFAAIGAIERINALKIFLPYFLFSFSTPFLIFLIYKISKNKSLKIKILCLILSIILFVIILFANILATFIYTFDSDVDNLNFEGDSVSRNQEYRQVLTTQENLFRIEHFPINIPENAKNYHFSRSCDLHGEAINYVKFNIDNETIQSVIDYHKDKIFKKINYSKIDDYYKFFNYLGIDDEDKEKYDVYILKQQKNDDRYTSGFITSFDKNFILFFYFNFDIKPFDAKF